MKLAYGAFGDVLLSGGDILARWEISYGLELVSKPVLKCSFYSYLLTAPTPLESLRSRIRKRPFEIDDGSLIG